MNLFDIKSVPSNILFETDNGSIIMDGKSIENKKDNLCLRREYNDENIELYLRAPQDNIRAIQIRWNLRINTDYLFLGDDWERGYGDLSWTHIQPDRIMPWYFMCTDGKQTMGYGIKVRPNAMCYWQVDPNGVSLWLDVKNGGSGVVLGNRELHLATVVNYNYENNENPFKASQKFCKLMSKEDVEYKAPIYGGNNWYYAYGQSSYEEIIKDTKLIADLSEGNTNRPFMVIDDGWQICHNESCNGGPWSFPNYKFNDMKKLANEISSMDVKPGIWFRPLLTAETVEDDMCLSNKRFKNPNPWTDKFLDPSHPKVLKLISDDVKRLSDWGYKLIKHDFSTFDIFGCWGFEMKNTLTKEEWNFYDKSKTTAEIIKELYRVIKNSTSGKALIMGCNTIGHLGAGIFDIQRTGDDTSGLVWGKVRRYGVNTLAFRMAQHKTFFNVDADCIGITDKIDWNLNKQWLELLAYSGTPLFVSCSPSSATNEIKEDIKKAFKVASTNSVIAEPLDWITNTYPQKWNFFNGEKEFDWYGTIREKYTHK